MSDKTLPETPEVEETEEKEKSPKKAKKKRSFLFHLFRLALIFSLLLIIFIASLPSLISSTKTSETVLRLINERIPGTIHWSNLELRPVQGKISIIDFQIIAPENDTAFQFDTLRLHYSFSELFQKRIHVEEIALIKPHADISIFEDGSINIVSAFLDSLPTPREKEPKAPKEPSDPLTDLPVKIIVDTIYIDSLSLTFQMEKPSLNLTLDELNIGVNASLFPIRVSSGIDLSSLTYSDPDRSFTVNSLDVTAGLRDYNVDTLAIDLRTANDSLLLSGSVSDLLTDTISTDIKLNCYLAVKTVSQLAGQDIGSGGFSLNAHLTNQVNNPSLKGKLYYGGSELSGVKINHISVPISLKDRRFSISPLSLKVMDDIDLNASLAVELKKLFPQGFLKEMAELSGLSYSINAELNAPQIPNNAAPLINSYAKVGLTGSGVDPEKLSLNINLDAGTEAKQKKKNIPLTLASSIKMNSGAIALDTTSLTLDTIPVLSFLGSVDLKRKLLDINGNMPITKLSLFNPFIPGSIDLSGTAGFDFSTSGNLTAPAVELAVAADELSAKGYPVGDIKLNLTTHPDSGTVDANCSLLGTIASLDLTTSAELFNPGGFVLKESPNIALSLKNGTLHLSPATKALVNADAEFSADYNGWIDSGLGKLNFSMGKLTTDQATIDGIDLNVGIKDSLISVNSLGVNLYDSAAIRGTASYHLNGNYKADITSDTIDLESFVSVLPEQLATSILLQINGKGSVKKPSLDVDLSLPILSWENVELGTQDVSVKLRSNDLTVTGDGLAELNAKYNIKSTEFEAAAVVDSFLLAPVAAIAKQDQIAGVVTADVYAKGTTKSLDTVHAEIPLLSVTMDSISLISGNEISASYGDKGLKIDSLHITLLDTGWIDIGGTLTKDEVMDFSGDIEIPLIIAERFTSDIEKVTGSIRMKGDLSGTLKHPKGLGDVSFNNVSLLVTESQQQLHKVSGGINVTNSGIRVNEFTAYMDDGYVKANGAINLESKKVTSGDFKMNIVNLPINIPNTMDLRLGGNIEVSADKEYQGIVGTIELLECYFYQYIDPLPPLSSQPKRTAVKTKKSSSVLDDVNIDLKIVPRQNIMVDNNLAYFDIRPELAITGKVTNPSVEGRMNVVTGEINYLNREFTVSRGVIDFVNPYEIAPEVDIVAETEIDQWDITIRIDGTVGEELRYVSTSKPALADNQILSLILTGKLSEDFDSQEFLMSQLAAAALDNLNSTMDIELSTSGMKIGEELSRRLYTEYAMGMVDGEMQQIASVLVKLFDQLRMRGYASTTGDAGGEVEFNVKIR